MRSESVAFVATVTEDMLVIMLYEDLDKSGLQDQDGDLVVGIRTRSEVAEQYRLPLFLFLYGVSTRRRAQAPHRPQTRASPPPPHLPLISER